MTPRRPVTLGGTAPPRPRPSSETMSRWSSRRSSSSPAWAIRDPAIGRRSGRRCGAIASSCASASGTTRGPTTGWRSSTAPSPYRRCRSCSSPTASAARRSRAGRRRAAGRPSSPRCSSRRATSTGPTPAPQFTASGRCPTPRCRSARPSSPAATIPTPALPAASASPMRGGSALVDAGLAGHINAASGLGAWDVGQILLDDLLATVADERHARVAKLRDGAPVSGPCAGL